MESQTYLLQKSIVLCYPLPNGIAPPGYPNKCSYPLSSAICDIKLGQSYKKISITLAQFKKKRYLCIAIERNKPREAQ